MGEERFIPTDGVRVHYDYGNPGVAEAGMAWGYHNTYIDPTRGVIVIDADNIAKELTLGNPRNRKHLTVDPKNPDFVILSGPLERFARAEFARLGKIPGRLVKYKGAA